MGTRTANTRHGNDGAILFQWRAQQSYFAEVRAESLDEQSHLIERLIDVAFDTLGARHLDVRVVANCDPPRNGSRQTLMYNYEVPLFASVSLSRSATNRRK